MEFKGRSAISSRIRPTITVLSFMAACQIFAAPAIGGDDLPSRLTEDGQAFVVVMLERPTWPPLVSKQTELTWRLQSQALDGPLAEGFEITHRFQTVPAVAGWITSEGHARVQEDMARSRSAIRAINLDVTGGAEPLSANGGWVALADTIPLIDADVLHAMGYTGAGVKVAILDSGIDTDHPDLMSSLLVEQCFCYNPNGDCCHNGQAAQSGPGSAEDDNGHGSHCSGIVASDGVVAPVGMAPDADITMIKMLDSNGGFWSSSDIVAGLDWLNVNRPNVSVVSMSLQTNATFGGVCDNDAAWTMALHAAVQNLVVKDVMVVAVAGNYSLAYQMVAPGCLSNVFNVGATDDMDVAAAFSNSHTLVDVFAPGVGVVSDWPGGGTSPLSGTSMACPHVAGLAALIQAEVPAVTHGELAAAITSTGVSVTDLECHHPSADRCRRRIHGADRRDFCRRLRKWGHVRLELKQARRRTVQPETGVREHPHL